jgi:hypothetical protein
MDKTNKRYPEEGAKVRIIDESEVHGYIGVIEFVTHTGGCFIDLGQNVHWFIQDPNECELV